MNDVVEKPEGEVLPEGDEAEVVAPEVTPEA